MQCVKCLGLVDEMRSTALQGSAGRDRFGVAQPLLAVPEASQRTGRSACSTKATSPTRGDFAALAVHSGIRGMALWHLSSQSKMGLGV